MTTLTGQSIGKYKLLERLGRGGMAEVYKAHHPKLDRIVAVKILHGYLAEGDDFLGRFEREAQAVAILRHPHIVQIHDFDVDNGTYYMVMEYIDNGTLQDQMDEFKRAGKYLPLGEVLQILKQVAEALDYAHKKGIIHRDIKPSNILLGSSGDAFLADFGIARIVSSTQFTSTGALIGTPTYMSPEQSKGLELTSVSDVYSLGIIVYELLTGQAPFAADTPLALIQKHVSDPLPSLCSIRPALPSAVEAVISKTLEKEPGMRYQSAGKLAHALAEVLTPDLIAELDQGVTKKTKKELAPQPTEKMSEASLPGRQRLPTVTMSDEERAGIGIKPPAAPSAESVPEEPPIPVAEKKPGTAKGGSKRVAKSGRTPGSSWKERLRSKPLLFGIIGLVIVVVLIIVFTSLPKNTECQSVQACISLAEELNRQGNPEGAIAAYGRAGEMVPLQEHQQNAGIWCMRADLLELIGRHDEAMMNREMCTVWQRGE